MDNSVTQKSPELTVSNPEISVILATKGYKTELLERCIESLLKQSFKNFEIILVYSVYPESIRNIVESNNILALKETYPTLSAARNLGVKRARGDLISFIDDDAEAPTDWLQKIQSIFHRDLTLCCLGGPHFTPVEESNKSPLRFVEGTFLEAYLQTTYHDKSAVGKIAGCNVSYRRMVFTKMGYLNEKLKTCEDWAFHLKLVENGYSLRFDPEVIVLHHRQGLKHLFQANSNAAPFFLSWKTLKFARHESLFASFYITNFICLFLLATLFVSLELFAFSFVFLLLSYILFTVVRTRTLTWRIIYLPLAILLSLARLAGFYYGLFRSLKLKLQNSFHGRRHNVASHNII
jgi:glycosyltransferase involved in cell wall biosynthesis